MLSDDSKAACKAVETDIRNLAREFHDLREQGVESSPK
jgi:hypothetical protein